MPATCTEPFSIARLRRINLQLLRAFGSTKFSKSLGGRQLTEACPAISPDDHCGGNPRVEGAGCMRNIYIERETEREGEGERESSECV